MKKVQSSQRGLGKRRVVYTYLQFGHISYASSRVLHHEAGAGIFLAFIVVRVSLSQILKEQNQPLVNA